MDTGSTNVATSKMSKVQQKTLAFIALIQAREQGIHLIHYTKHRHYKSVLFHRPIGGAMGKKNPLQEKKSHMYRIKGAKTAAKKAIDFQRDSKSSLKATREEQTSKRQIAHKHHHPASLPNDQGIFFTSLPKASSSIERRVGEVRSVPVSLLRVAEPGWKPMWTAKSQAARRLRRWCRR
jgi:hypothetical protein